MRVWHYTTSASLEGILKDGEIRCDKIYLKGEIPVVWLSTNPNWEETVRKAFQDRETGIMSKAFSREGILEHGFSPIRIEIDSHATKITHWKDHRKKIPSKFAHGLEVAAKKWGANPAEWWVSYKPIPIINFISPIECWDGKQWITAYKKEMKGGD